MDISVIFCRIGRKPLKDLVKRILCILSIFILKYLSIFILMKAVSVPWEERFFFEAFLYSSWIFFLLLKIISTSSKNGFPNQELSHFPMAKFFLFFFFFLNTESSFTT